MSRIFVSSSAVDQQLMTDLVTQLRGAGHEVGFDLGQASWETAFYQISQCDVFVFVLSPAATQRHSPTISQLGEAQRIQKPVVLVGADPTTPPPPEVAQSPYINMSMGASSPAMGQLLSAISFFTGEASPPQSAPPAPAGPPPGATQLSPQQVAASAPAPAAPAVRHADPVGDMDGGGFSFVRFVFEIFMAGLLVGVVALGAYALLAKEPLDVIADVGTGAGLPDGDDGIVTTPVDVEGTFLPSDPTLDAALTEVALTGVPVIATDQFPGVTLTIPTEAGVEATPVPPEATTPSAIQQTEVVTDTQSTATIPPTNAPPLTDPVSTEPPPPPSTSTPLAEPTVAIVAADIQGDALLLYGEEGLTIYNATQTELNISGMSLILPNGTRRFDLNIIGVDIINNIEPGKCIQIILSSQPAAAPELCASLVQRQRLAKTNANEFWVWDPTVQAVSGTFDVIFDGAPVASCVVADGVCDLTLMGTRAVGVTGINEIAFASARDGDYEIYVMNVDGSNVRQLTYNSAIDRYPTWSPDGSQIAFASNREGPWELYIMDNDGGNTTRITVDAENDSAPVWSPDGTRLAYQTTQDIWVVNVDGTNQRPVTASSGFDHAPSWSPDGTRLTFMSNRDGDWEIYVVNVDSGEESRLTQHRAAHQYPVWSPSGDAFVFSSDRLNNDMEIYTLTITGTDLALDFTCCGRLTNLQGIDTTPNWSPDQQQVVFASVRSGNWDIYVVGTGGGDAIQLTNDPAEDQDPAWSPR